MAPKKNISKENVKKAHTALEEKRLAAVSVAGNLLLL